MHVIQLDMDPLRWVEGFSEECTQRYAVCVCVCVGGGGWRGEGVCVCVTAGCVSMMSSQTPMVGVATGI